MARCETQKMGSIPLHTLDADVDYAVTGARTTYGTIGIKVWIYRGKFGEETEPKTMPRRRPPARRRRSERQSGTPKAASTEAAKTQGQENATNTEAATPPAQDSQEKPSSEKTTE
jgi:small subunit ribosomal protein S3